MYTEKKRTLIIIIISIMMNLLLFVIAYYCKLPLWLDTTGTIYASIILGFPAGFVVAIINNLVQAACFYGAESLSFYIVSALTAFISGCIMKTNYKKIKLKWLLLTLCLLVVSVSVAVIITFIANKGIPADYWGSLIYRMLIAKGYKPSIATVVSVSLVKILDVIFSVVIVMLLILFTPKVLKSERSTVKIIVKGKGYEYRF